MEKKEIKVYATPTCAYCYTLKEFLKENNIVFEDIDISQNEKARDYMVEKSGQMEVPVMEIDGEIVIGFNKKKISNILGII